jgi:tripartite-type tricarboxylate transporter receptor subunit TctC
VTRLNEAINKVLQMPEVRERYAQLGADVVGGSPEKLRDQVQKELAKWSELIKETGMKAE